MLLANQLAANRPSASTYAAASRSSGLSGSSSIMYTLAPSGLCDSRSSVPLNMTSSPSATRRGTGSRVMSPPYFSTLISCRRVWDLS